MLSIVSADGVAKFTQSAGTINRVALGGLCGKLFTHVTNIRYTDTGTAHTLTLMRGATRTSVVGAVAAAGTAVVLKEALYDGAGNAMAASDVIAIQLDNGTWHLDLVSAISTTSLTLTTAVPTGRSILDGAKIVCYGVPGDTMHANQQYDGGSGSAAVNIPAVAGTAPSLCKASSSNEPIIFSSNNASNAGTLNYANCVYTFV